MADTETPGFTVTVMPDVVEQPAVLVTVYKINTEPGATPVTTPVEVT